MMNSDESTWQPPFASPQEDTWQPPFDSEGTQLGALALLETIEPEASADSAMVQTSGSEVATEVDLPAPVGNPVVLPEIEIASAVKILDPNDEATVQDGIEEVVASLASDDKEDVADIVASILEQVSAEKSLDRADAANLVASVVEQIDVAEGLDKAEYSELVNLTVDVVKELANSDIKLSPKLVASAILKQKGLSDVSALKDIKMSDIVEQVRILSKLTKK